MKPPSASALSNSAACRRMSSCWQLALSKVSRSIHGKWMVIYSPFCCIPVQSLGTAYSRMHALLPTISSICRNHIISRQHEDVTMVLNKEMLPAEGYIRLYRFKDNGKQLELIHRTPTGGIPGALTGLKGKLLAGVGSTLRVYEAGKKKLLRKCEHRKLPTHIMTLATSGDRIYVGDQQVSTCSQSMHAQRLSLLPCLAQFDTK